MCFCIGHVGEQVLFCITHGSAVRAVGVWEDMIQVLIKHLKAYQPTNQATSQPKIYHRAESCAKAQRDVLRSV